VQYIQNQTINTCAQLNTQFVLYQTCDMQTPACVTECTDECSINPNEYQVDYQEIVNATLPANTTCQNPYASCAASCAAGSSTSAPTPLSNSTCHYGKALESCDKSIVPPQNASSFDAACTNVKNTWGSIQHCVLTSTAFGNCTVAACETECNSTDLWELNTVITHAAIALSGGLNGTCTYASCTDACTALAPSSAAHAFTSTLVAAAVLAAGWTLA